MRTLAMIALLVGLTGCWNEPRNISIRFGDVSLGQQMIDLKRAFEEQALTEEEYEQARAALLEMVAQAQE